MKKLFNLIMVVVCALCIVTNVNAATPADYSKIDELLDRVIDAMVIEDQYTEASYQAMMDALNAVDFDLDDTKQAELDAMAEALEDALDKLKLKSADSAESADYTKVDEALSKVEALNSSNYTEASYQELENAVNSVVKDLDVTKQTEVDAMALAIENALNNLELKSADYTRVFELFDRAAEVDENQYTEASYQALMDAIDTDLLGLDITRQAEVDAMALAIETALNSLQLKSAEPADYTKVFELFDRAAEVDENQYTEASYQALMNAIDPNLLGLDITRQAEVDAMADAIEAALNNLELKSADYTEVYEILSKVEALNSSNYTEASYQELENAVNSVIENLDITRQAEVDAMAEAIKVAYNNLVEKKVNEIPAEIKPIETPVENEFVVPNTYDGIIAYIVMTLVSAFGMMIFGKKIVKLN